MDYVIKLDENSKTSSTEMFEQQQNCSCLIIQKDKTIYNHNLLVMANNNNNKKLSINHEKNYNNSDLIARLIILWKPNDKVNYFNLKR